MSKLSTLLHRFVDLVGMQPADKEALHNEIHALGDAAIGAAVGLGSPQSVVTGDVLPLISHVATNLEAKLVGYVENRLGGAAPESAMPNIQVTPPVEPVEPAPADPALVSAAPPPEVLQAEAAASQGVDTSLTPPVIDEGPAHIPPVVEDQGNSAWLADGYAFNPVTGERLR